MTEPKLTLCASVSSLSKICSCLSKTSYRVGHKNRPPTSQLIMSSKSNVHLK